MKRICLFAGYDRDGIIDDYVVNYLKSLTEFADVYYFADCDMKAGELEKLKPVVCGAYAKRHGRYDFGSWGELMKLIGFEKLAEYDRLLLVNDSGYGPLHHFKTMFDEMDSQAYDAWAMCGNKFLMSFFISVNNKIIRDKHFQQIFAHIEPLANKNLVVHKYERGLSRILSERGYKFGYYINPEKVSRFYKENRAAVRKLLRENIPFTERLFMEFRPNKVRLYSEDYIVLTMMGMPVLKSMFFKINDNIAAAYWQKVIVTDGNYPLHLIENHIKRMKLEHQAGEAVRNKLKDKLRRFFYEHKIKNNRLITKICKIPVCSRVVTSSLQVSED